MATRSLGTLTIDLIAKTGGFVAGMDRASRTVDRRSREIEKRLERTDKAFDKIRIGVATTGVAIAGAVAAWVNSTTRSMDATLKMAQQIGTTTNALTGLRYAAQQFSNVSDQTFDMSLRRMTRRIAEAADGSGAAKSALERLNLSAKELAGLSVDEQFLRVSDAMKNADDQGQRLRATMAIFDTEGVPLVNALSQGREEIIKYISEAERLGIVISQDAAIAAAEFQSNLTKVRASLEGVNITLGNQVIPVLSEFVEQALKASTEVDGVLSSARGLAGDNSIPEWVRIVGSGFAHLIDVAVGLAKTVNVVAKAFQAVAADAEVVVRGMAKLQVWNWFDDDSSQALSQALERRNQIVSNFNESLIDLGTYQGNRYTQIWNDAFERTNIMRQFGYGHLLKDEAGDRPRPDRPDSPTGSKQVSELQRLIQQMEQQRATLGMTTAQAERYRIETAKGTEADRARALSLFDQIEAWKEADKVIKAAAESAKLYEAVQRELDLYSQGFDIQIAGIGMGNRQRELMEQENEIRREYAERRRQLEEAQQSELTRIDEEAYNTRIQLLADAEDKKIEILREKAAEKIEAERSWTAGASRGLQNYADEVNDVASSVSDAMTNAFKGMEDSFVSFVKTGKLDFKSLADSIISDMARIAVQQMFLGPIADMLGGGGGSLLGGLFGGGRASGGPVSAGSMYEVNERGTPELLNIGNRQFLMMGAQSGRVTPMKEGGGGQSVVVHMTVNTPDAESFRRSQNQIERQMFSSAQRALARA